MQQKITVIYKKPPYPPKIKLIEIIFNIYIKYKALTFVHISIMPNIYTPPKTRVQTGCKSLSIY